MISDTLKNEPRYRKCLRTTCAVGQIHEAGDDEPLMTCMGCGFRMCFIHARSWHEGQTCSQYEASERHQMENNSSAQLIERLSKRCPGRGCNAPIEKNEGCDHMTCKTCITAFEAMTDNERKRLQLQVRILLAMSRSLWPNQTAWQRRPPINLPLPQHEFARCGNIKSTSLFSE